MARIDLTGRICLEPENQEPIDGWAIVVHGRIAAELIFTTKELAQLKCVVDRRYVTSDVVPVVVTGEQVRRVA